MFYKHFHLVHCEFLSSSALMYLISTFAWATILVVWCIWTYAIKKDQTLPLQSAMTAVPILKLLDNLLLSIYTYMCPWESQLLLIRYFQMIQIAVSTIDETLILAFVLLMCQGLSTVRFSLTRNQATTITILMGVTYLAYSAYFVTDELTAV